MHTGRRLNLLFGLSLNSIYRQRECDVGMTGVGDRYTEISSTYYYSGETVNGRIMTSRGLGDEHRNEQYNLVKR